MSTGLIHYYRKTEAPHSLLPSLKEELKASGLGDDANKLSVVETESCFNIMASKDLTEPEVEKLEWLLAETFEKEKLQKETSSLSGKVLEFGPRMTFTSAFSSNATSICRACALPIPRLELSRRYQFVTSGDLTDDAWKLINEKLHDRMTEQVYPEPLTTFDHGVKPVAVETVPIMSQGRAALEKINKERGLGFDDFDLDYYTNLFQVSANGKRQAGFIHISSLQIQSHLRHSEKTRTRPDRC